MPWTCPHDHNGLTSVIYHHEYTQCQICGERAPPKVHAPQRRQRFLCICQAGHSRSVALARALHARQYQAVAIGCQTSPDAIAPLAEWADMVFLIDCPLERIPAPLRGKCVDFYIGPDRWVNPYHPELAEIWASKLDHLGIHK